MKLYCFWILSTATPLYQLVVIKGREDPQGLVKLETEFQEKISHHLHKRRNHQDKHDRLQVGQVDAEQPLRRRQESTGSRPGHRRAAGHHKNYRGRHAQRESEYFSRPQERTNSQETGQHKIVTQRAALRIKRIYFSMACLPGNKCSLADSKNKPRQYKDDPGGVQ